jgi:arginyl-tRNA synthetase
MKEQLSQLIQQALDALVAEGRLPEATRPTIVIERTRDASHGDLASNVALTLAKGAGY